MRKRGEKTKGHATIVYKSREVFSLPCENRTIKQKFKISNFILSDSDGCILSERHLQNEEVYYLIAYDSEGSDTHNSSQNNT